MTFLSLAFTCKDSFFSIPSLVRRTSHSNVFRHRLPCFFSRLSYSTCVTQGPVSTAPSRLPVTRNNYNHDQHPRLLQLHSDCLSTMAPPPEELTPPHTPTSATSMQSTPLQPISQDASPQTHGSNDNMSSPSLHEETMSSPSIRQDSPRPSPLSTTPYFMDQAVSPLFSAAGRPRNLDDPPARLPPESCNVIQTSPTIPIWDTRSDIPKHERAEYHFGNAYQRPIFPASIPYVNPYAYADEREEGYEDEDESMELSDVDEVPGVGEEDMGGYQSEDWSGEEKNGDTIEDVMNLPGKSAPPAPFQDFSGFYPHDQPTPDENKGMRVKRLIIEKDLDEQARRQALEQAAEAANGVDDIEVAMFDGQGRELDSIHVPGFQALQDEIGMHAVEDEEAVAGALEVSSNPSQSGLPLTIRQSLETYGPSPFVPSRTLVRRASEDTPLPSTSFINFPSPTCAAGVVSTPGGKHIDFASTSTVPETPFTKTLSYFKQYKGKENSPSKRRRNASSPEEIAELAREAAVEEQEAEEKKELGGLEKYRELDLAPEEPVMESTSAGDLIMCGTPVRTGDGWFKASVSGLPRTSSRVKDAPETWTSSTRQTDLYPSDSETEDWVKIQQPPATPSPQKPTLPIEQDEDHDADVEESEDSGPSDEKKQIIVYPRHPTFVTVIGMLPKAMFWATAASVTKYGSRAFDVLVERLTGLEV
jgi:hypothetical protein